MSTVSSISQYIRLSKPGVSLLVVFSAFSGMLYASSNIDLYFVLGVLASILIGSCGAAAFNMWYDRDIDELMSRTKSRPIPSGAVSSRAALFYSLFCMFVSVPLMFYFSGIFSAFLLLFSVLFYSVVYTVYLKRSTCHNIVIGGVAGSLPPMIGFVSVAGYVSMESFIMFCVIFLWTPPHFWALALLRAEEYRKVGVPMLPVVYGSHYTKISIILYSFCLLATTICFGLVSNASMLCQICNLILSGIFLVLSIVLYFDFCSPYRFFKFSILYLFLFFILVNVNLA